MSNTGALDQKDLSAADYGVLHGLTLAAIGDSYFGGHGIDPNEVWLVLLARKYGMTLCNHGINGSSVSCFHENHKRYHPMCLRYSEMPDKADIVILEGGRNDFNIGAPVGETDSRDMHCYAGALNTVLDAFHSKYPDALIIGITPWYVNEKMKPYSDKMLQVCAGQSVPCFHAADQTLSTVYMTDPAFRAEYCVSPGDISHLNAEGMKYVLPVFEKFIGETYTEYLKSKS